MDCLILPLSTPKYWNKYWLFNQGLYLKLSFQRDFEYFKADSPRPIFESGFDQI